MAAYWRAFGTNFKILLRLYLNEIYLFIYLFICAILFNFIAPEF